MEITRVLYTLSGGRIHIAKGDFRQLRQEKLNKKYWKLYLKWREASMECYRLDQRLRYQPNSSLFRKYKNACAKASELGQAVTELEKEKNKNRNR